MPLKHHSQIEENMSIARLFGKKTTEKNDEINKDEDTLSGKNTSLIDDESQKKPRMKSPALANKIDDKMERDGELFLESKEISKKSSQKNMFFSAHHEETSESHEEEKYRDFYEKKFQEELREINNSIQKEKNKKNKEMIEEGTIGINFKEKEDEKSKFKPSKILKKNSEEKATSPRARPNNNPSSPRNRATLQGDEKKYVTVSPRSPRSGSVSASGNFYRSSDESNETKNSFKFSKIPQVKSKDFLPLKNQPVSKEKETDIESMSSDSYDETSGESKEFVKKFSFKMPMQKEKSFDSLSVEKSDPTPPTSPRGGGSAMSGIKRRLSFHAKLPVDELPNSSAATPRSRFTTDQIAELFAEPWHFSLDRHGNPDLGKIPEKILVSLSKDAHNIIYHDVFEKKTPDEQKVYLKQEIGKRFIKLVEQHLVEASNDKALGSTGKMKSYLKSDLGIIIGDEKSRKKLSKASKDNTSPGELGEESTEFHEVLLRQLSLRMKNYKVDYIYANNNQEEKDWLLRSVRIGLIENYKLDRVESSSNALTSGTFQRDFPHSIYQVEDENGKQKLISDVQEFIDFLDGSKNQDLCYKVSHHACQNLSITLRNVLFGRVTKGGDFVSVMHLDDGTPLSISDTIRASYIFKKQANGGILLKYKGQVNARASAEGQKDNATLLLKQEDGWQRKPIFVANAKAEITWEISFDAEGKADYSAKPKIMAEGWNQFTQ